MALSFNNSVDTGSELKPVSRDEKPRERPRLLSLILIGLFLYGGFSYSLSLLEYTFFQVSGQPVFGVTQTYTQMSDTQRKQLIRDCGTQLMGANGMAAVPSGSSVVVRCGRFWPFYRYSLRVPASPAIPGVDVKAPAAAPGKPTSALINHSSVRLLNYVTFVLAILLFATSTFASWQIVRRKDERKARRWSLRAFAGSMIVVATYMGMTAWMTPDFAMGW